MYRRGIREIPAPINPLQQLLAGLGQGLGSGMEMGVMRNLREKDQKKNMLSDLLFQIATGQIDPRILATPEFEAFGKSSGVERMGGWADVMKAGQRAVQPQMGPPSPFPYTMQKHQEAVGQEQMEARRQQKLEDARIDIIKTRQKDRIEQNQLPRKAQKQAEAIQAFAAEVAPLGMGIDTIKSLSYGGATFETPLERRERETKEKKTQRDDYYRLLEDYEKTTGDARERHTSMTDLISKVRGNGVNLLNAFVFMFGDTNTNRAKDERFKTLPPEDRIKLLVRTYNNEITGANKEIRRKAQRVNQKPSLIKSLKVSDFLTSPDQEPIDINQALAEKFIQDGVTVEELNDPMVIREISLAGADVEKIKSLLSRANRK